MQPNVPIPTDNLYKFQALFGLVLIISGLFAGAYVQLSALEKRYSLARELVESSDLIKPEVQKQILRQIKTTRYLEMLGGAVIGLAIGAGVLMARSGFKRWGEVQPVLDELLELQVAKARKEAHGSNVYRELPERPEPNKSAE